MSISRVGKLDRTSRENGSFGFEINERKESNLQKMQRSGEQPVRNEQLDTAAKMYEKQFLGEMMKAMRSTVSYGNDKPSMGENIYREQLDQQYVDSWGEHGGIGLADIIYNQVMEKYFNASGPGHELKGSGGIPITDRDVSKVIRVKTTETPGQVPLRIEVGKSPDGKPAKLQAPWSGEVVSNARLEGGKTALTVKHSGGLSSTMIFQGVAAADAKPGSHFEKGAQLGVLSPEVHSFTWNLNKGASTGSALGANFAAGLDSGRDQKMQALQIGQADSQED